MEKRLAEMFGRPFFFANVLAVALRRGSIGMIVAPVPVFFLFFFLGFCVVVIFAVFFGKEAAPRGLFVVVPLTVMVVAVVLRCGRCRRSHHESGAERCGQGCGQQKRCDVLVRSFEFVHADPPCA
jgi:hypothetical protein